MPTIDLQLLTDLRALLHADRAVDAAHDALQAAKIAQGRVGVGTFHPRHPLVVAVREAKRVRAAAIARLPQEIHLP